MLDYWLILPLTFAVAIGWWLGRYTSRPDELERPEVRLHQAYFDGLDYLINEQTDEAIESFIRALEVNSDTIPAHIALAKLFRRKGDVQRATNIHQNLLARSDLTHEEFMRVQMALAKDYYAVGLFDRAENLLQTIIRQHPSKSFRYKALTLLIELYEQEREWNSVIETAEQLTEDECKRLAVPLGHYVCEMAESKLKKSVTAEVDQLLTKAEQYDPLSVRVCMMRADLHIKKEQYKPALDALLKVLDRDPIWTAEIIPSVKYCYLKLGDLKGFQRFLDRVMKESASTTAMLAMSDLILDSQGVYAAGSYITDQLKRRPTLKGFNRLISLHLHYGSESSRDSLQVLYGLTSQLEQSKPVYQCVKCGFSGKKLLWQCPSCKKWGKTRPIQGLEGE